MIKLNDCPDCKGEGEVYRVWDDLFESRYRSVTTGHWVKCGTCKGTGKIDEYKK
jgi:DnaJ-class molecular chaperone